MAKVILTLEDTDGGDINMNVVLDPPLSSKEKQTSAQALGLMVVAGLKEILDGELKEVNGKNINE